MLLLALLPLVFKSSFAVSSLIITLIKIVAATVAPSQPFYFYLKVLLNNNKFYISPFRKWIASL